jgi:GNAT superfamily N-acetyltransferase
VTDIEIRALAVDDRDAWQPLWDGYNAFYGREGDTALDPAITDATWSRFFDPAEPVHAVVATRGDELLGLVHYIFHRSTTSIAMTCYLQDLFTVPAARGTGVGRALIEAVYEAARAAGSARVYWHTQFTNETARALYDRVSDDASFMVYRKNI